MKVSIIIPTIGRPVLNQVLTSLLRQMEDYPTTKIFISFDGEKKSPQFKKLQSTYAKYKNIIILSTNEFKSGASNARNKALQKALPNSDIIAFLGDDTIPSQDWLSKTIQWHKTNPEPTQAVLGRVYWVEKLQDDPLHKWLDGNIQFDFKNLDQGRTPDWRHFTTSNLSLKSKVFHNPTNLFNTSFKGWGFEDGELGYRLAKQKKLQISYQPSIQVFHDHPQTFPKVLSNLSNARKNAFLLEELHSEVQLLPRRSKKWILTLLSFLLYLIPKKLSNKAYWWSRAKLVWLGYKFPISDQNS